MKESNLKIIISLITIAVIGLIVVQLYWISNAFTIEREKFKREVSDALIRVVELIDKNETANVLINTLKKKDKRQVFVFNNYDTDITIKNIDTSLTKTVINNNIVIGKHKTRYKYKIDNTINNGSHNNEEIQSTVKVDSAGNKTINIKWISKSDTFVTSKKEIVEEVLDELIELSENEPIEDKLDSAEVYS